MKRILTIQDVSCVGKCSLTVALPIVSAIGVECAVIPTAVLSTHTAFKGFTFRDLTCDVRPIYEHWLNEKIDFDGIYTGYLGSFEQIDLVSEIFEKFNKTKKFKLVDPAMGDNGKLYSGFDNAFAKKMKTICDKADIIVPNLTEASFMLNLPYEEKGYDERYVQNVLNKLTEGGCNIAVLTGICLDGKNIGVYSFNKQTGEYFQYYRELLPQSFHGTGDVFASTVCGALAKGFDYKDALKLAVDYTVESIKLTIDNPTHNWYGVDFERAFPMLIERIK